MEALKYLRSRLISLEIQKARCTKKTKLHIIESELIFIKEAIKELKDLLRYKG